MSIFNKIKVIPPKRSVLNMSHEVKFTGEMGQLIPFMCEEVLPGDTFSVDTEMFLRFAPLSSPIMHRVNLKSYYFFVPNRLIWEDWRDWITGGEDGKFTALKPRIALNNSHASALYCNSSLMDYLGMPTLAKGATIPSNVTRYIDAMPFRAYQLIYNEYFRNQNLQDPISFSKGSGTVSGTEVENLMTLRNKNWELDYFTSALPFAQRGDAIPIPMSGNLSFVDAKEPSKLYRSLANTHGEETMNAEWDMTSASTAKHGEIVGSEESEIQVDNSKSLRLLSGEATINDLRTSYRLQRWLENNARAGSRYIEQILSHFGVKSSDARLQRPEFLGGGQSPVIISQVLQQSQTEENNPLGSMGGHGVSVGTTHKCKKFFEEHGFLIGICCVLPRTSYQQGMPRKYSRTERLDYYFPEFATLGEQEIKNKEVFFNLAATSQTEFENEEDRFGYQQRYEEYRYIPSSVHGDFKNTLSFWHLGRIFQNAPALNAQFVEANPRTNIFAVENTPYNHLWFEFYNKVIAKRPMPKFPIPSL